MKEGLCIISTSPEETRQVGAALAGALGPGDLIGLQGDLGAGKTVFAQGVAEGLDSPERATSPSFVLIHIYRGRLPLVHVDLYRLSSVQAEELGLEDYLVEAAGVVEWAERMEGLECDLWVEISFPDSEPDERHLKIRARSKRGEMLLQAITDKMSNKDG